jgi:hypothetical protein
MAKEPVKSRLAGYLRQQALERITESHWASIQAEFPDTSPDYLRRLLRDSGLPLAPLVEGVRQSTLPDLERTLLALEHEYSAATAAQDRARASACRSLAIEARNRARWTARKTTDAAKRAEKEEALTWLQTWLEYPPAFPTWVTLRKRVLPDTEDTGDTE